MSSASDLDRANKAAMAAAGSLARFGIAADEAAAQFRALAGDFAEVAELLRPKLDEWVLERQIRYWHWPAIVLWAVLLAVVTMGGGR